MAESAKGVLMENTQQKELSELRQTIKTSLHHKKQRKLKELKKLVQRYLLMVKPETMERKS